MGISIRTITDWKRERYAMNFNAAKKISRRSGVSLPKNVVIKNAFWHTSYAGKMGADSLIKKYGGVVVDERYREQKWREWWEKEGKRKSKVIGVRKTIYKPGRSNKLAEFVGIMIGDGGITSSQISITLHEKDDKAYSVYVFKLVESLFKVRPSVYRREEHSVVSIVVSRIALVEFCKSLGLKVGNKIKQKVDIPNWIYLKKGYQLACVRGLVDTDGCIFNECHRIKGKKYCYPRLSFVSASLALRKSVHKILTILDFSPKIRNNRSVHIESRAEIIRYFREVGTRNAKHKKRFEKFVGMRLKEKPHLDGLSR